MKKFGIVCLLPEEVCAYHQELRLKLVSQFGVRINSSVPAHITIKYPFLVEDTDEIEQAIQEFCALQTSTGWLLQGFNHFIHDGTYVVFMDVISSTETRDTHVRFLDRLKKISWMQWGPFDTADLHYHVTLATHGLTAENFESVWSFLGQQERSSFQVFFDNLAIVQIDEDGRSVYKVFPFQNGKIG